jgi:TonB family protein
MALLLKAPSVQVAERDWAGLTMLRVLVLLAFILCVASPGFALSNPRPLRIAVLDFGKTDSGRLFANQLADIFGAETKAEAEIQVIDRDQARAAAAGAGYQGSVNMALQEARDLASAMGCDFFFAGDAQTLRRSPSDGPSYFESFAAIYLVSGRTGKLVSWERLSVRQPNSKDAETALLAELKKSDVLERYLKTLRIAQTEETVARTSAVGNAPPVIEVMSDDQTDGNADVRAPRPYRRLKPRYPETAARAEVEAIVDVLVDIDARGEVIHAEIARWAGYELNQSVLDTVKQMHFFPAMRGGVAIPMRVLLRYNFRKPPKTDR